MAAPGLIPDDLEPLKRNSSSELLRPDLSEQTDDGLTLTVKPKRPLNLVLFGRRGAEKSSAAEAILGQTDLGSASSSSECVRKQGEVCGRWVTLVELPALAGKAEQEVMEESFRCISLCDPEGVHAFILVLPVAALTDEDKAELHTIQDTFSSRVNDFTIILFTVDSDPTAPAVVNFVEENKDIQELLQSCGGRSVVLNIRDRQQIPELIQMVVKVSGEGSRFFSRDVFTEVLIERILKLEAETRDVKQKSRDDFRSTERLRKEMEELKIKDEEQKKKHKEEMKSLRAQLEQQRQEKVQQLKEKDEATKKEREKKKEEHEEEEKKRRKQEELKRRDWREKLDASENRVKAEREQKEAFKKELEQIRRERNRERDAWDREKDNIWERMNQELKQNLEEMKKNLEEERTSHRHLQEEFYQKRKKWTYAFFALVLLVCIVLLYVYLSH